MYRPLVILFSCLLLLACREKEVDPHRGSSPALIPGEVELTFAEGTTTAEAHKFMSSLGLTFKSGVSSFSKDAPEETMLLATVAVPVNSEDLWVKRLLTYPIVKSAGRNVQVGPSNPNDPPFLLQEVPATDRESSVVNI